MGIGALLSGGTREADMGAITVGEFSTDARRAVERVEAGEILQITRDGRAIAELRPSRRIVFPARDAAWHAAVARLRVLMDEGMDLGGERITYEDKYGEDDL